MTRAYITIVRNGRQYENIEDLSAYFGDVIETLEKVMHDSATMIIKLILNIEAERS